MDFYNQQAIHFWRNRVEKVNVPLLIVGLGGTGCDVLRTIKKTFAERYILPKDGKGQGLPAPSRTAYLGIDRLGHPPDGLDASEYLDISMDGLNKIFADPDNLLYPHEKRWVDRRIRHESRQVARLLLSRHYCKIAYTIKRLLQNIIVQSAGVVEQVIRSIEIVVITGIGGNTGSGIFLDMCQILREIARTTSVFPAWITGFLVMPDASLANVYSASGMEALIKRNAYAALKELDFWMRVREHQIPYTMVYGDNDAMIEWNEPPFHTCYLMCGSNVYGIPYKDQYEAVRQTIADYLLHFYESNSYQDRIHFEDILPAIQVLKKYPLNYGYRTIGSFTKRIPLKAILYYEGSLLLKTFIPMRDESGKLQPDRRMFTDGQGKVRAELITGNGKQLLQDFRTNNSKLPGFCSVDLSDKVKIASIQSMNPLPHNMWHIWRDNYCVPVALETSVAYLDKAWERFEDFARSVIRDPEQGPFALEAYLDAQDGLISYLDEILASWKSRHHTIRSQLIAQSEENCMATWPSFRNPPMLGRQKALEQYKHAIQTLYSYVNDCEFLENHINLLEKLILRVKEYLRDGLKPLCASILLLEKEFKTQPQDDSTLVQDIYNLETIQKSIDDAFEEANANQKVSSHFLDKIAAISFRTQPTVDAKISGVEFVFREYGLQEMCEVLQKDLEAVYGKVNNQSLDDIMVANVGDDVAAQQRWMSDLANSVLNSSLPMFLQDTVFTSDSKAPYSYMSIPQDAKEHLKYIKEAFKTHDPGVEPKPSYLTDHIYALTAWDKLPLYRYGRLEELRVQYDKDLDTEYGCGLHLVQTWDDDLDFRKNWSLLPSPKPYFLFNVPGTYSEKIMYIKVKELVNRGIACGMIEVHDDLPYAKSIIHLLYADEVKLMSGDYILQIAKEIEQETDPETGDVYSDNEISNKLFAFLHSGKTVDLTRKDIKPTALAGAMNLDNQSSDPFDRGIQDDLDKVKTAKDNYRKLCIAMAEAMIYTRPDILWALNVQLAAYEKVYKKMEATDKIRHRWDKRHDFAETAAEIFLYLDDIIYRSVSGLKYKENGQKHDIIIGSELAEELRDCESYLVKTAAFLADVDDRNSAKADLIRMMNVRKRAFIDAIDDETLTLEEMNKMIESIMILREELICDQETLEHKIHVNPSKKNLLQPQIDMVECMQTVLKKRLKNCQEIAKGLD